MSFILDALKKSETERQRADAPALYEVKMAPARQGVALWLIVLGGLLVINIVVLAVVLLRGTHGAPQLEATNGGAPPAAAPAPAAAMTTPPANPAPTARPPPNAQAPDNTINAAAAANDGATAPAAVASRQADDDAPAVDAPHAAPDASTPGVTRATGVGDGDVPTYQDAASAPGANLPELKLDLHSYAANPRDRFVFLNMVNLKEGETSPAGVRVESITPDGAILSWHGTRFFLQRQ